MGERRPLHADRGRNTWRYFNTVGTQYLTRNYHTNFDVLSAVDFGYLRLNLEVINDIWVDDDRSSLPILDFVLRGGGSDAYRIRRRWQDRPRPAGG